MNKISKFDAKQNFYALLDQVAQGEQAIITSNGKPVAYMRAFNVYPGSGESAKARLLLRLRSQTGTTEQLWTRSEIYDRTVKKE